MSDDSFKKEAKGFLMQSVMPDLVHALTELSIQRPSNPHKWLAEYLLRKANVSLSSLLEESKYKAKRLIIAGAPASGKGTQCELIVEKYNVVHISTGDLLREAVRSGSELGKQAGALMEAGQLVPDALIIGMVKERLSRPDCAECGWLLDGFPRTEAQAEALVQMGIIPDAFIYLDVPDEILVERVVGRRSDPVTGKIYHLKFNPPPQDPEILGRLVQRKDDNEETVVKRLEQFHAHIRAVQGQFMNKMLSVDGSRAKLEVFNELAQQLDLRLSPRKIIIAGAPASGKGTQCELIVERYGVVHISTGDLLRAAAKSGSELGKTAAALMEAGQLVPDDLIIGIVRDRLSQSDCQACGWLLDGFPRTEAQAEALVQMGIVPDSFIYLSVPDEILVERVVGRRSDSMTGKIYHLKFNPPPQDPEIEARLVQRKDDNEETVVKRLKQFHAHINAVRGQFANKLFEVDGSRPKLEVFEQIVKQLETPHESLKLIIAGAPASGKGTQCELLVEQYGIVHISTGDLLRAAAKSGSELGKTAAALMEAGQLVPDELIIGIVRDRLAQPDCLARGWLLDGFPRTEAQAQALVQMGIVPNAFIYLHVPDEILVERVVGRRSDPVTGKIYHLKFNPPPEDPEILGRLVQRKDDNEETVVKRLEQFHVHIQAVQGMFADRMVEVDGSVGKMQVFESIVQQLGI